MGLIRQCWDLVRGLWDHRNEVLHRGPTLGRFGEERRRLDLLIRQQLARGLDGLPAGHRRWFSSPVTTLLSKSQRLKRVWLDNVLAARARQSRRSGQRDSLSAERALLRRWLQQGSRRGAGGD